MIFLAPFREIVKVDIWGEKVAGRSSGTPNVHRLWQRAAAVVLSRLIVGPNQSCIHKHRKRIFCLSRRRDLVDVAGILPGHEEIFCAWPFAEYLFPVFGNMGAGNMATGGLPDRAKFWKQVVTMLLQIRYEFFWSRAGKCLVSNSGMVSRLGNDTNFILNLHHDDGMRGTVFLFYMAHQRSKGACIGIAISVVER